MVKKTYFNALCRCSSIVNSIKASPSSPIGEEGKGLIKEGEEMKLINNSENGLMHSLAGKMYFLAKGATADIPQDIAKIWLRIKGIKEYIEPKDLEKAKVEAEALKEEVKKLKEDIAKAKNPAKKSTKKSSKK